MKRIVVAITGASGSIYGIRLLKALCQAETDVELVISPAAGRVLAAELNVRIDVESPDLNRLLTLDGATDPIDIQRIRLSDIRNVAAGIASGSYRTDGMVICPCSTGTLAAIAHGISTNLIHRAADVHLKERRKLILVPRETPLSSIQLGNMKLLSDAGAIILPAMPGFYHRPDSVLDLVDFIVARICDQLNIPLPNTQRWGE